LSALPFQACPHATSKASGNGLVSINKDVLDRWVVRCGF